MTDEQIVLALTLCNEGADDSCAICPYANTSNCYNESGKDALDLINRQKAEIERLCEEVDELIIAKDLLFDEAEALIKKAKAEAVKEFAERLKRRLSLNVRISNEDYADIVDDIENLAKELTEGEEDDVTK